MFSLKLFGQGSIDGPEGPITGRTAHRQRLALMALLVLSPDGRARRDKLMALLSPERDTRQARHFLSDAVYVIRKELSEDAVLTVGDGLELNPEVVHADVDDFEEALATGDLTRAVELYVGPLLEGFHLNEAPEFERWLDGERDRLRRAHAPALEGLARECAGREDPVGAARWWRRLAAHDPYNARIALELMQALDAAGDRAGAVRYARVYGELLREELEMEPEAEVLQLAEDLRKGSTVPSPSERDPDPVPPEAPPLSAPARVARSAAATPGEGGPPANDQPVDREPVHSGPDPSPSGAGNTRPPWRTLFPRGRWVVAGCLVLVTGILAYHRAGSEGTEVEIRSLAVLPLENLSGDPMQEYVADGMTEALIGSLARLPGLRVTSRTSVMRFKGSERPLPEIAQELGVDALVEGSVQRANNRIQVNVQLVHGPTDDHLWAAHYERELTDMLLIQNEIAQAVGEEIRGQLPTEEASRIASATSVNPSAYEHYIVGRYHFWRFNEDDLRRAIEAFEEAIRIEPEYAAAHAGLARAWWARGMWGQTGLAAAEGPARAAARRALELDDRLAEAFVVQADIKRLYDWDWAGAESAVLHALELEPDNVEAHHTYALLLMALDRLPEALAHIQIAERMDPLAPAVQSNFGRILYRARRFEDALARLNRALELEPRHYGAYGRLGDVYEQMGRYDEALDAYAQAAAHADPPRAYALRVARVHARTGNHTEARKILEEASTDSDHVSLVTAAAAHAALGDQDEAFALLFRNAEEGGPGGMYVKVDPPLETLHADPRWPEVLRRMNLPPQ